MSWQLSSENIDQHDGVVRIPVLNERHARQRRNNPEEDSLK